MKEKSLLPFKMTFLPFLILFCPGQAQGQHKGLYGKYIYDPKNQMIEKEVISLSAKNKVSWETYFIPSYPDTRLTYSIISGTYTLKGDSILMVFNGYATEKGTDGKQKKKLTRNSYKSCFINKDGCLEIAFSYQPTVNTYCRPK